MILAVVGSRHIKNKKLVYEEIDKIRKEYNVTGIVSGVAEDDTNDTGPDTYGRDYATDHDINYIGFPALWNDMSEPCKVKYTRWGKPFNALAGPKRNTLIAENADIGLSIWDGKSKGTKDTMDKMTALGKYIKKVICE
jgi:hypothetical protein